MTAVQGSDGVTRIDVEVTYLEVEEPEMRGIWFRAGWFVRRLCDRARLFWWRVTHQREKLQGWEIFERKFSRKG